MNSRTRVLIALAVLAGAGLALWQSDPSPVEPSSEPAQQQAAGPPAIESRETFVDEEIPRHYPTLLKAMRVLGGETVIWTTQSGESRKQAVTLGPEGLLIETSISVSAPRAEESPPSTKTTVKMLDANLDGRMDSITFVDPSGETRVQQEPFDETSQFIWDSALAIAIRFGRCCR
jgi:hypothetical protein